MGLLHRFLPRVALTLATEYRVKESGICKGSLSYPLSIVWLESIVDVPLHSYVIYYEDKRNSDTFVIIARQYSRVFESDTLSCFYHIR